jgi:hypothetical protein
MSGYVLAQFKVKWGNENLKQFYEAADVLTMLLGSNDGPVLRHSLVTQYGGQLYEIWYLWEVEDADHLTRSRQVVLDAGLDATYHSAQDLIADVCLYQQRRYVEDTPLAP